MSAAAPPAETFVACLAAERPLAERLADALSDMLDPQSCAVSLFECGQHWAVEAAFHDPDDRKVISSLVARIAGPERSGALTFSSIAKRDWVAASLEGLAPVRAGGFVVHGSHDRARVRPNQIGIEIEAALAFGTGHHGTTRGCLLAFERLRKAASRRLRILDVGTGTGVLAIAAARALRVRVLASDIDPQAVAVARDNARLNRVGALLRAVTASGIDAAVIRHARYDLIFANILEAPLRRMSAGLPALLVPGGHLILSGLLASQAAGVIAAYRRQGLRLQARLDLDGWVTLTMRR